MVSTITYNGDGATRIFPVSFKILGEDYIRVYVDNVQINDRTTYDIINNSIVFSSSNIPPVGVDNVEIIVATSTAELGDLPGSLSAIDTVAANIDKVTIVSDNIDLLINTANGEYLVSGLPATGTLGDLAVNVLDGKIYEYRVTGWVVVATSADGGGTGGGTSPIVPIEPTLPPAGTEGEFRYNTTDGQFYVYIDGEWKYITAPPTEGNIGIQVYATNPTENLYEGMVIFNTTENKLLKYVSGSWVQVVEPTTAGVEVADASITTAKFAAGITPVEVVSTLPTTGNFVGRTVVLTTDGKLYRYSGSAFTAAVPTTDLTGTIGATQIADNAITTPKIATGAITADEISANAITSDKITANAITTAKISAGAIGASQIAAGAITTEKIYAGAVAADKIAANSIDSTKIVAGAISSDKLAANSVTAGAIAAGAISTYHLGAQVVTANQIAAGSITASKLSVDALDGKSGAFSGSRAYASSGSWTLSCYNSASGASNGGIHSEGSGYGIVGHALGSSCVGVFGYIDSTDGAGVKGKAYGWGVFGESTGGSGQWGLITNQKCYAAGGYSPFTGSHITYSKDKTLKQGMVVSSNDAWCINIDQTLIHIEKAKLKAKNVVGVVSYVKNTLTDNIENNPMIKEEHKPYIDYMKNNGFFEVEINSLGEGGILVSNTNGNIENGDYLVSDGSGYAMKQDDDILHNYTVAKALESVDWSKETATTKLIACTYHCG